MAKPDDTFGQAPDSRDVGVRALGQILRRRAWVALLPFLLGIAATLATTYGLPDVYEAQAVILVEGQQVPESYIRSTVTTDVRSRLRTISEEILSRSRLEKIIKQFSLYPQLQKRSTLEEIVGRMRQDISIEVKGADAKRLRGAERSTVAFAVGYSGRDPRTVMMVSNTLASIYIEENLKVRERHAASTTEFLESQLGDVRKRIEEQEQAIGQYKERFMGELPQQLETNLKTLDRLQLQAQTAAENLRRAEERRALLVAQLAEVDVTGELGGRASLVARLEKLHQELASLLNLYTDKYPDVVRLRHEIKTLEAQLAKTKTVDEPRAARPAGGAVSPYALKLKEQVDGATAEAKGHAAEGENLRQLIANYQRRVEHAPKREQELNRLVRDYDTTRELYRSLLGKLEEARLAETMEQRQKGEHFRILDPATLPGTPLGPNRLRILLLGLALAVGLGVGATALAERFDTSFHGVEDLQASVRVPVLVSISRIVTEGDLGRLRKTHWLRGLATALGLLAVLGVTSYLAAGNEWLANALTPKTAPPW